MWFCSRELLKDLIFNDINAIIWVDLSMSRSTHEQSMATLIVRNIDDAIVKALKQRASDHGVSAEAEHRKILEQVLLRPAQKSFAEALRLIPSVGNDADFERMQDDTTDTVFD